MGGFAYNQVMHAPEAEGSERFKRAEQVFGQKLWREQLREWDEVSKPAAIAKHRELQAIDPDKLSDAELIACLKRCRDKSFGDDLAAYGFYRGRHPAGRRLPRPCRRLDGAAAG